MNKYLEKIAAARKATNKVELEPGVHYDLTNHELKPTTAHMQEYMDKKDRNNRLISGAGLAVYGGVAGGFYGLKRIDKRLEKEGPIREFQEEKYTADRDEWRNKRPYKAEPTKARYNTADVDKWMKDSKSTSLDHIPESRDFKLENAINERKYRNQMRSWYKNAPEHSLYWKETPSGVKQTFTNIANKYGKNVPRKIGAGIGGLAGALITGALGYSVGGLDPSQKKPLKNAYLDKLERKHEKAIDRLEGWDEHD